MIYENVVPYEHILSEKVILKEGMKNKGQKEKRLGIRQPEVMHYIERIVVSAVRAYHFL